MREKTTTTEITILNLLERGAGQHEKEIEAFTKLLENVADCKSGHFEKSMVIKTR